MGMPYTIDDHAEVIKLWADVAFPDRQDSSMFIKLYGEIAELTDAEGDDIGGEVADVLIMVLDYAKRKGVNIDAALTRKMNINRARTWKRNELGHYSHVEIEPSRVQQVPGDGNGHASASGQTLAHDRDHQDSDPCGTHGECGAARLGDCPHFAGGFLSSKLGRQHCPRARYPGSVHGGYPEPHQAIVASPTPRRVGACGHTGNLFHPFDGTNEPGSTPRKIV